jgi:branched-chain amino acid transport system substrate-binding protein
MVAECPIAKQIQLCSKMKGGTGMFGSGDQWLRKGRMFRPVLCVLFMGIVMLGFSPQTQAAEKGPIRIGFIAPITGNWAQLGTDMVDGFKMFLDEINYTVAGRKIEFIVEDETANPAAAVTKARKLITHNQVHLIAGIFIVSSAYATAPVCIEAKIPLIGTVCTADDLTQRKASKYFIRLSYTSSVNGHVAGDYAFKKLGWRKAIVVGMDYAWGYEVGGGFQQVFEDAGGKIVQKVWTPMNTLDFSPYITDLKRDVDGMIDVITGAQTVRFIKGLRASGHKWQVIGPGAITDETALPAMGDDAVGIYSVFPYSVALNTPENAKFIARVKQFIKRDPTSFQATNYSAADWVIRAIKSIDGDVENKEKLLQALHSVEMPNSVRGGPLKLDSYGNIVQNQYIRRVDKVGNKYQNTILETYPMVSQFWTYNPETYMKQPEYSRDYPPCKFCP